MITAAELSKSLCNCSLRNGVAAADAIESGSMSIIIENPTDAENIRDIYEKRSQYLSTKTSEHARRLKEAADEFLREMNLRDIENVSCINVPAHDLGSFVVWIDSDRLTPIGCLYVVSKQELSESNWHDLWHEA